MADQPYFRPYEPSAMFADGRSNRPLERGVIHRDEVLEFEPLATGLTREEWDRAYALGVGPKVDLGEPGKNVNREVAIGSPRYDPPGFDGKRYGGEPRPGPKIYVDEFPFPMTHDDIKRGQERYTIYCAVCHGALGNGEGKIWERGYLRPTSFHTAPVAPNEEVEIKDGIWYERVRDKEAEKIGKLGFPRPGVSLGFSRGYAITWQIKIPLREVPVGYFFEVMTRGYAGMPSYSAQIPPADRWRIAAYIRVLQLSRDVDVTKLTDDLKRRVEAGGKP